LETFLQLFFTFSQKYTCEYNGFIFQDISDKRFQPPSHISLRKLVVSMALFLRKASKTLAFNSTRGLATISYAQSGVPSEVLR
jgi:hypothetical protein